MKPRLGRKLHADIVYELGPRVDAMDQKDLFLKRLFHLLRRRPVEYIIALHHTIEGFSFRASDVAKEIYIEHQQFVTHYTGKTCYIRLGRALCL